MADLKNRQTYSRLAATYKSAKSALGKRYYLEMDYEKFFPEKDYERLLLEGEIPGGIQVGEYIEASKAAAAVFKEWQNNLEAEEKK